MTTPEFARDRADRDAFWDECFDHVREEFWDAFDERSSRWIQEHPHAEERTKP